MIKCFQLPNYFELWPLHIDKSVDVGSVDHTLCDRVMSASVNFLLINRQIVYQNSGTAQDLVSTR